MPSHVRSRTNGREGAVLTVVPRAPDDPDLLLVVTYKNWAAGLDGR